MPGFVNMVDANGNVINVSEDQVVGAVAQGFRFEVPEEQAQRVAGDVREREFGGTGGQIAAGVTGALRGATFGLSDVALGGLTGEEGRRSLSSLKEVNPITSTGSEIAGMIAPALLTGGGSLALEETSLGARALARTPAGYLGRFAAEGVTGARAVGGLEGAAKVAAYSGAEGAGQAAGSYISEVALGDRDLTAEGFAGALGHGFAFGAAAGTVLHGVERGTIAARRMFARTAEGGSGAALTAEQELARSTQVTLEAQEAAAEAARAQLATAQQAREVADLASKKARAELLTVKNDLQEIGDTVQHGIPGHDALTAHLRDIRADSITQTMPANELLEHGIVNDSALKWSAASSSVDANTAPGAGVIAYVSPSGKVVVRGQLGALKEAAESGGNVKVHWSVGREPHPLAEAVSASGLDAERKATQLLEETKAKIAAGQVPGEVGPFTPEGLDLAAKRHIGRAARQESDLAAAIKEYDAAKAEMEAVGRQVEIPTRGRGAAKTQVEVPKTAEIPEYSTLQKMKSDYLESTVPARSIADRGYYEPPIKMDRPGLSLEDADPVRMANARKAISEGQRDPVSLVVSESGKIQVEGGRHRLQAAIEADAPIKVKWSYGYEPSSEMVARGAAAQSPLERQLAAMKTQLDSGADIGTLSRTRTASPRSPEQLETAYEEAVQRGDSAVDVAEKQMHLREAAALEEQLKQTSRGRSVVDDVGDMAPVLTRYERAAARVTELAGESAPEAARAHAAAFREAESNAERRMMDRTARAIDDAQNPLTSPEGKLAKARGAKTAAEIDLARARVAETEASIGARAAEEAAKTSRAAYEAAQPKAPDPGAFETLAGMPAAHAIPIVGPMLSRYAQSKILMESARRFVGRVPATATGKAAALAARVRDKIASAVDRSLGLVERSAPAARQPAVAALTALERRAFDDGGPGAPKGASTTKLAAIRIREVAAATTRPDLVIAQVRREMRDVTDPDLIEAVEKHRVAMYTYLNDNAPKGPPPNPYTKREWEPSPAEALRFARRLEVANDPVAAFEALHQQCLTPEAADTLRAVWPKLFGEAQQRLVSRAQDIKNPVAYDQLLRNSLLFDVPLHPSLESENAFVLRSAFAPVPPTPGPNTAQPPVPSISGNVNLTALYQPGPAPRTAMR